MGPSDHMTFALKKIPVLFFFTGLHADYHRPTDTADKVNYWGMQQAVTLGDRVAEELAKLPREQYVSKYDGGSMGHMAAAAATGAGSAPARAPAAGTGPHWASSPTTGRTPPRNTGVRISGTSDGIRRREGWPQGRRRHRQLRRRPRRQPPGAQSDALARAKPGDKVHLTVLREGKKIETDAVLTARKG